MGEVPILARYRWVFNPTTGTLTPVVTEGVPYIMTSSRPFSPESGPRKCKTIIVNCPDGTAKQELTEATIYFLNTPHFHSKQTIIQ
jgi:hypothetical protein